MNNKKAIKVNSGSERMHEKSDSNGNTSIGRTFHLEMYTRDAKSGAFQVELAVDSYESIFNEWDPSPYKRRDIAPDLRDYLEDCAHDIPLRFPMKLVLAVPTGITDTDKETHVRAGLRNYFGFVTKTISRRLKRLRREAMMFLMMAAVLLLCSNLADGLRDHGLIFKLLLDGVLIGTWIFAWEAVSAFLFGRRRLKRELARWQRYLDAEIEFVDGKPAGSQAA